MGNIEKFDFIANQYDSVERIKQAKIIADEIKLSIIGAEGKSAIDYGCGTGLVGIELLDVFSFVLFIDASSNMLEEVKQKIEGLDIQNAEILCCDLEKESPKDLFADYIIMAQTLLHIKDIESILSSLYDILNEDGHLLIIDFDENAEIVSDEVHNGFEQEKLISVLKKIGFTKANAKTFYHGEKIFMNKDASLFILDAAK